MFTTEETEQEEQDDSFKDRAASAVADRALESDRVQEEVDTRFRDVAVRVAGLLAAGGFLAFGGFTSLMIGLATGSGVVMGIGVMMFVGVAGVAWYGKRTYGDEVERAVKFVRNR